MIAIDSYITATVQCLLPGDTLLLIQREQHPRTFIQGQVMPVLGSSESQHSTGPAFNRTQSTLTRQTEKQHKEQI